MSRPTVTVISASGEVSKDTLSIPNVFKVSMLSRAFNLIFYIRDAAFELGRHGAMFTAYHTHIWAWR
jgi:hypothetical protein